MVLAACRGIALAVSALMRHLAVLVIVVSACTPLAAPPPVWPSGDRPLTLSIAQGVPVAPTKVTVSTPQTGKVTLRGVVQDRVPLAGFIDPTLQGMFRPSSTVALRLHGGLSSIGASTLVKRTGLQFEIAGQTHSPLFLVACVTCEGLPWEVRAQVAKESETRFPFVVGLGASVGRRVHGLALPEGPLATYGVDQQVPVSFRVYRHEARLEGTLGVAIPWAANKFWLTWQPYVTALHGTPTAGSHTGSPDLRFESIQQTWGGTIYLSLLSD